MPNIVLTRIDNRLVHGQVATQWCGAIGANLILVANDEVAGNSLRQGLMNMAAPVCHPPLTFSLAADKLYLIFSSATGRFTLCYCRGSQRSDLHFFVY